MERRRAMKRLFDLVVAACALALLSPLLALAALAVWLSSPGPVVYRGVRVGRGGSEFSILKFRSMRVDPLASRDITVHEDPRVTSTGRLLRATKVDELPQLWNVIRGEMSLVGPRPESPRYVAQYTSEQREALCARPGITGLTQIYFRHEERLLRGQQVERYYETVLLPVKLAIDIYYVRHQSLWLDLKILALTLVALIHPLAPPRTLPFKTLAVGGELPHESYPLS
jgi:lipopolysaccharide/colanic/teichoic acid biosynthesis glycosyltransferase